MDCFMETMPANEIEDTIAVMLKQEASFYCCPDYLIKERQALAISAAAPEMCPGPALMKQLPSHPTLVHIVEECANLVTDSNFSDGNTLSKSLSMASFQDVREIHAGLEAVVAKREACGDCYDQTFSYWRQQMFDWSCMVVDSFQMDREIVAMSFNLLDRYVAYESAEALKNKSPPITRDDFQLFSMTCLYLAVKVLNPYPKKISVKALVDMSRGFYTEEDITVTETEILSALKWHINPPTAMGFCRLFWKLFPCSSVSDAPLMLEDGEPTDGMLATAATLTEIAISDPFFVAHKPSVVALASVIHASRLEGLCDAQLHLFVQTLQDAVGVSSSGDLLRESGEFMAVYRQLEKLYCQ